MLEDKAMPYLSGGPDATVLIAVHVQPKASRNAVTGIYGESLKIAVTTAPVDGKANKAVIAFLAKSLGLAKRDVELHSGQTSRRKIFRISGSTIEELRGHIESIIQG
jgi:uncharacterized protein (TIGR00251 family)